MQDRRNDSANSSRVFKALLKIGFGKEIEALEGFSPSKAGFPSHNRSCHTGAASLGSQLHSP